jgi:hypothetical protein
MVCFVCAVYNSMRRLFLDILHTRDDKNIFYKIHLHYFNFTELRKDLNVEKKRIPCISGDSFSQH